MANFSLYKFQIELSDIPRGRYETLEFRAALHPSESLTYFLTRILAYALNIEDGLTFAPTGLHDPDAAAMHILDTHGGFKTLIEIGSPSARKLHKATKQAKNVKVYTYKNPQSLIDEIHREKVHRAREIEIYSFAIDFLSEIEAHLKPSNHWGLLFNEGTLNVQMGEDSLSGELSTHY
jgi:uncharacterized protein YaeQ